MTRLLIFCESLLHFVTRFVSVLIELMRNGEDFPVNDSAFSVKVYILSFSLTRTRDILLENTVDSFYCGFI